MNRKSLKLRFIFCIYVYNEWLAQSLRRHRLRKVHTICLLITRAELDRETCCFETRAAVNGSRGKGFALCLERRSLQHQCGIVRGLHCRAVQRRRKDILVAVNTRLQGDSLRRQVLFGVSDCWLSFLPAGFATTRVLIQGLNRMPFWRRKAAILRLLKDITKAQKTFNIPRRWAEVIRF